MTHRRLAVALLTIALIAGACGGGTPRELSGYRRQPAPMVGDITLPDLTTDGADLTLEAESGHLLVVYFGYTKCPDFCPTTLSDLRLATQRMDEDLAAKIDVAMVTVDPARDTPVLADYITSFFDGGHALATDDSARLAQAAAPFGVSYSVDEGEDGSIEVAHTTALYVVDDTGHLALTWQFGVAIDDLAADLSQLLEESTT
jgi:protein SCO1/2